MYPISLVIIGILGVFVIFARTFFVITTVCGQSMHPTLLEGDRLLVMRYLPNYWLQNGQIVIGQIPIEEIQKTNDNVQPQILFVKRLIGLPGDEVTLPLTELRKRDGHYFSKPGDHVTWVIPRKYCFVKGDAYASRDSVMWGPISQDSIMGVVLLKLSPHRNQNLHLSQ